MKSSMLKTVGLLALVTIPAQAAIYQEFDFTGVNKTIPDGNPSGVLDTQTVNGFAGVSNPSLTEVRVYLDLSGGYNGDLYGYLYGYLSYETGFCVLLNRPGKTGANPIGYADTGFSATFSDAEVTDVHGGAGTGPDLAERRDFAVIPGLSATVYP
jgi:hypothetical protein